MDPNLIPGTVPDYAKSAYGTATDIRATLKTVGAQLDALRKDSVVGSIPDAGANASLSFRHLEDASMRLGCVLRALDGGTTADANAVGAIGPNAVMLDLGSPEELANMSEDDLAARIQDRLLTAQMRFGEIVQRLRA